MSDYKHELLTPTSGGKYHVVVARGPYQGMLVRLSVEGDSVHLMNSQAAWIRLDNLGDGSAGTAASEFLEILKLGHDAIYASDQERSEEARNLEMASAQLLERKPYVIQPEVEAETVDGIYCIPVHKMQEMGPWNDTGSFIQTSDNIRYHLAYTSYETLQKLREEAVRKYNQR